MRNSYLILDEYVSTSDYYELVVRLSHFIRCLSKKMNCMFELYECGLLKLSEKA